MVFRARARTVLPTKGDGIDGAAAVLKPRCVNRRRKLRRRCAERMTVRQDARALASDKTLWRWVVGRLVGARCAGPAQNICRRRFRACAWCWKFILKPCRSDVSLGELRRDTAEAPPPAGLIYCWGAVA